MTTFDRQVLLEVIKRVIKLRDEATDLKVKAMYGEIIKRILEELREG